MILPKFTISKWTAQFSCTMLSIILLACSEQSNEQDCVPAEGQNQPQQINRTQIRIDPPDSLKDAFWCQACVWGPKGWASCQMAYATNKDEGRTVVAARSREAACKDAGFKEDLCPPENAFTVRCKGDPEPKQEKDPSRALQDIFFGKSKSKKEERADQQNK